MPHMRFISTIVCRNLNSSSAVRKVSNQTTALVPSLVYRVHRPRRNYTDPGNRTRRPGCAKRRVCGDENIVLLCFRSGGKRWAIHVYFDVFVTWPTFSPPTPHLDFTAISSVEHAGGPSAQHHTCLGVARRPWRVCSRPKVVGSGSISRDPFPHSESHPRIMENDKNICRQRGIFEV